MSISDTISQQRINELFQNYFSVFQALINSANANFPLACLVSVVGLVVLATWALLKPERSRRLKGLAFCAVLLLTLLPSLWFFNIIHRQAKSLDKIPNELWIVLQKMYFSLKYQTDWLKSITPEQQTLLIALSMLASALLTIGLLLLHLRARFVRFLAFFLAVAFTAAPTQYFGQSHTYARAMAREIAAGETLFDEKCKIAGSKRFKSVQDAGIRLTVIRSEAKETRLNRDWQDAGVAKDRVGQAYINSFLDFEFIDSGMQKAWGVSVLPGRVTMVGFQYVDVMQANGNYLRYRKLSDDPKSDTTVELISPERAARYAVNYARNDTPKDRLHWVSGGTVTITDTTTGEVLGELKAFSHVSAKRSSGAQISKIDFSNRDWEQATTCPEYKDISDAMVRMFVEQVVRPAR